MNELTTQHLTNQQQEPQLSTRNLLLGIWGHLSLRRRIQLGLLLAMMLVTGLAELGSLGAVLPFLAVLSDPVQLSKEPMVQALMALCGITNSRELLLLASLALAVSSVLAALIRLTNLWMSGRLAAAVGSDLSCEAYRRTLYQPYQVHVQRNSAAVITATTRQINETVAALNSLLQLITASVVATSLFLGFLLIDAQVASATAVIFCGAYGFIAFNAKRKLRRNGKKIAESSRQQLKALQEGLGAIRDVLLDGSQTTYLEIYRKADRPQRQLNAKNAFLGAFPRYALEALGMVLIALLGGLFVLQRDRGSTIIPLLGVFALGAQRILPALQQIYSGWATLKGFNSSIAAVLEMLNQPLLPSVNGVKPLLLKESICFEGVHFRYGSQYSDVLQGLDVQIHRGERIGLVGSTGSGKSTMVDLLMGLLSPSSGRLLVDGFDLHDLSHPQRLTAWRRSIAHVPQTIYLSDSSIAENIAFGVPRHEIDMCRVRQTAAQAQLASFIESSPEGYRSFVGERGICLSGGQRQRIGIARALYKQAQVLVLDEATSALDISTEDALMDAVDKLSKNLTIVMIAHRLSTLQRCDKIITLNNGVITSVLPPHLAFK